MIRAENMDEDLANVHDRRSEMAPASIEARDDGRLRVPRVGMLADLLEELTPQLVRRVKARAADSSHPTFAPPRCQLERTQQILGELIRALRAGVIDLERCRVKTVLSLDVQPFLATLRRVRECVYDL